MNACVVNSVLFNKIKLYEIFLMTVVFWIDLAGDRCICQRVPVCGPAPPVLHLNAARSLQAASALHPQRAPTLLLHQRSQVPPAQEVRHTESSFI